MHHLNREQCQALTTRASRKLLQYCRRHGIHYLVTGSSGRRDSAVTLALAEKACLLAQKRKYALTSVGVVLPCASKEKFSKLGRMAAKKFNAKLIETDLTETFRFLMEENLDACSDSSWQGRIDDQIIEILNDVKDTKGIKDLAWAKKIARGNVMARLRMITLYHIARMLGSGMVLSTDNLSDLWMGFWTICGDVGDYGMIQSVLKGLELEDLANYLGVPKAILAVPPDDGLGVTKKGDAGQLGADYKTVDEIMAKLVRNGFNPDGNFARQSKIVCRAIDNDLGLEKFHEKLIVQLAFRSLNTAFKRRGTVNLTRKQLGLPDIKKLDLS